MVPGSTVSAAVVGWVGTAPERWGGRTLGPRIADRGRRGNPEAAAPRSCSYLVLGREWKPRPSSCAPIQAASSDLLSGT